MAMLAAAITTGRSTAALAVLAYVPAALELVRQTREAVERQWRPRVLAHPW
ncbi:MAG: hypothetical protein JO321_11045 [Solirubrobacterales bacterium]|nr:hypothetical protein [Solirubrobacterales bacterium]